jgi:hypothetical protein
MRIMFSGSVYDPVKPWLLFCSIPPTRSRVRFELLPPSLEREPSGAHAFGLTQATTRIMECALNNTSEVNRVHSALLARDFAKSRSRSIWAPWPWGPVGRKRVGSRQSDGQKTMTSREPAQGVDQSQALAWVRSPLPQILIRPFLLLKLQHGRSMQRKVRIAQRFPSEQPPNQRAERIMVQLSATNPALSPGHSALNSSTEA